MFLECSYPFWCAKPGGAIIPITGSAEVCGLTGAIGAVSDIVQVCCVGIEVCAVDLCCVARKCVDAGNYGRGCAGAAIDRPASFITLIGIIDRYSGVRISNGCDIGYGPELTLAVALPCWLADVLATAAARASPGTFCPATRIAGATQCCSPNCNDILKGGRELDSVPGVARAGREDNARMMIVVGHC